MGPKSSPDFAVEIMENIFRDIIYRHLLRLPGITLKSALHITSETTREWFHRQPIKMWMGS
jgi:hypothetical protein